MAWTKIYLKELYKRSDALCVKASYMKPFYMDLSPTWCVIVVSNDDIVLLIFPGVTEVDWRSVLDCHIMFIPISFIVSFTKSALLVPTHNYFSHIPVPLQCYGVRGWIITISRIRVSVLLITSSFDYWIENLIVLDKIQIFCVSTFISCLTKSESSIVCGLQPSFVWYTLAKKAGPHTILLLTLTHVLQIAFDIGV